MDVLIECEQKQVIANSAVQTYTTVTIQYKLETKFKLTQQAATISDKLGIKFKLTQR